MLKRKRRESIDPCDGGASRALRTRTSRLQANTEQGTAQLHQALKIARGFERQKLGRRQKNAQENPQDLLRLKGEVIALQQLDLEKTARRYLFKQLVRTKRIRNSPDFISLYGNDAESKASGPKAGAETNVVGRLMNSNPVRGVVPGTMKEIHHCLGLDDNPSSTDINRGGGNLSTSDPLTGEVNEQEGENGDGLDLEQDEISDIKGNGLSHISEFSGDESSHRVENFIVSESDLEEFGSRMEKRVEDRLASSPSSSSSSISKLASEPEEPDMLVTREAAGTNQPRERSWPFTSSPHLLSSAQSPPPSRGSQPKSRSPAPKLPSNTTFLPSLTVGGYMSGSDGDSDPDFTATATRSQQRQRKSGVPLGQTRQNRRGQRERRQIAEKKYGKNAKHVLTQQAEAKNGGGAHRDTGWDPKKGATDPTDNTRDNWQKTRRMKDGGQGKGGKKIDKAIARGSNPKKSAKDDAPLHPSWEAAQVRKRQQMQTSAGSFKGKKITFD